MIFSCLPSETTRPVAIFASVGVFMFMMRLFIGSGIACIAVAAGSQLSVQEMARRAHGFTALVECWK